MDQVAQKYLMFRHPFTCICAGPTSSGKTEIIRDILGHNKETIFIETRGQHLQVLWCHGQYQKRYTDPINDTVVTYYEGVPTEEEVAGIRPDIIVIDDLMNEIGNNEFLSKLFTKGSHHLNLSVIFIVQNLFHQAKAMRNTSLNAQYIILMKNVRDKRQIQAFGSQMYPGKSKYFMECYEDATSGSFGYLMLDLRNDTPDDLRLRTRIIPSENGLQPIIYTAKQ
jgi:hypothetical protein